MRLDVLFLAKKRNDSSYLGQPKMEYDSSNLGQGEYLKILEKSTQDHKN